VTVPVVTGMDQARNVILVRSRDAVIAARGRCGTLSEIGLAVKLGRPVIGLGTWRPAQPEGRPVPVVSARTPEDAVARARRAGRRARRPTRGWLGRRSAGLVVAVRPRSLGPAGWAQYDSRREVRR
jgi:hypothetical protein